MHDLIIRGGTIADGSGGDTRVGDVAVDGSIITAVGEVDGPARREVDAEGQLVTPGWVDIHTHYDGQATWDPEVDVYKRQGHQLERALIRGVHPSGELLEERGRPEVEIPVGHDTGGERIG